MHSEYLSEQADDLERKIKVLVNKYIELKESSYFLEKENNSLKEYAAALVEENKKLKIPQKNGKIVEDSVEEKETVIELKKQVSSYIVMIDECIDRLKEGTNE